MLNSVFAHVRNRGGSLEMMRQTTLWSKTAFFSVLSVSLEALEIRPALLCGIFVTHCLSTDPKTNDLK